MKLNFDANNLAATGVEAEIEAASLNSREPRHDDHLKSADFLEVEKFPTLSFESTNVRMIDSSHARLTGNLTIRSVTKPVKLDVETAGLMKTQWGSTIVGFTATTKISRKDWNLTWNVVVEGGGVLVSDDINLDIEVEFVKVEQEEKQPA